MKKKLSPFDCDMCAMIENITKTPVNVELLDDKIGIKTSVLGMHSQNIIALTGAIKGRAGERIVSMDISNGVLEFYFNYDPEYLNAPEQYRYDLDEPKEIAGSTYCRKLKEVKAVLFTEQNVDKVVEFTGGGTLTIPSSANTDPDVMFEPSTYEFPTPNGILLKVYESEYIVKESGQFYTIPKIVFEKDFERK